MKQTLKNKKGAMGTAGVIGIILALVLVAGGVYWVSQSQTGLPGISPSECADSTGILTVNSYSALSKSTNVSPTIKVGVNGQPVTTTATSGTTTFGIGDTLKIHASLSDYIDTEIDAVMTCGGLQVDNPMFYSTSDNPSIEIRNDDGDEVTNAVTGGATNQTDVTAGSTFSMKVKFIGTSTESSGDGIYVVEFPASTSANITKVELVGLSTTNLPKVHTSQNAGSKIVAFDVPAIEGSAESEYTLKVTLGTSSDLMGGVYTDWYAKQKFIDLDGSIKYGVEDSDGTAKYENTADYDFYINSA